MSGLARRIFRAAEHAIHCEDGAAAIIHDRSNELLERIGLLLASPATHASICLGIQLKEIAADNDGVYKFVSEEELGK